MYNDAWESEETPERTLSHLVPATDACLPAHLSCKSEEKKENTLKKVSKSVLNAEDTDICCWVDCEGS